MAKKLILGTHLMSTGNIIHARQLKVLIVFSIGLLLKSVPRKKKSSNQFDKTSMENLHVDLIGMI